VFVWGLASNGWTRTLRDVGVSVVVEMHDGGVAAGEPLGVDADVIEMTTKVEMIASIRVD
jgi:hypothetical protein